MGNEINTPPFVKRGLPGPFHSAIAGLEGRWNVQKQIFIAGGTADKPTESKNMVSHWVWVGTTAKHLVDTTEGTQGDSPYYRLGILGFSNVDECYEWVTFDGLNANLMLYRSAPLKATTDRIELTGVFSDQGVLGEGAVGRLVPMRTVIELRPPGGHTIELYFTRENGEEILIDRSTYTRL